MPGHVRNKNIQYDDDDFYDDDDYYDDDYDYDDEPVAAPKAAPAPAPKPAKTTAKKDDFDAIAWGQIALDRRGVITEERQRSGRLLGGSGKPSKLQALAAQRRKEQEAKRAQEKPHNDPSIQSQDQPSTSVLDKLSKRTGPQDDRKLRQDAETTEGVGGARYKRQRVEQQPSSLEQPASDPQSTKRETPPAEQYLLRASPSAFASAAFIPAEASLASLDESRYQITGAADHNANHDPFAGPSPDDVVQQAQKKGQQPAKKQPSKSATKTNGVTNGVAAMKISEPPTVKSKNLDVPSEMEKSKTRGSANFVVIGHVDHGKSTLMGRLLLDVKHRDMSQRDYQKLQKASEQAGKGSFALAWAMDARADEREHGVTIDIATQHFQTDKTDFTILDAPGHQDFIKNMISGTSQADFAVLVVDASTDAFEAGLRGQTREHAMLARSMGVNKLVVAVNKMDAAKWQKERYDEIVAQLQGFFGAAGLNQKSVIFVPCAGLTGDNVVRAVEKTEAAWYTGPSLVQALEASEPRQRKLRDPLRFTVSDVFANTASGAPTGDISVTGLIDAGNLQVGTRILAQPSGQVSSVKGIELNREPRDWAVAGQIVTLHLVGVEEDHLRVGDVLCEKGNKELQNVRKFTAKCLAFEHLLPARLALHRGQIYCSAKIQFLELMEKETASTNGAGPKKKKPRVVHPQQVVRMLVDLYEDEKGLPLENGDRVIFREEGKTAATGIIDGIEEYVKQ